MIILSILLSLLSFPAYAVPSTADVIMVHDMEMIRQQKFRMEEINDYNDVQTEKERFQKKNEVNTEPLVNKLFGKRKFVEDNGQIKIKNDY